MLCVLYRVTSCLESLERDFLTAVREFSGNSPKVPEVSGGRGNLVRQTVYCLLFILSNTLFSRIVVLWPSSDSKGAGDLECREARGNSS